jgi:glycosyltransferase involved in cell wall biosynthesis
MRILHVVPTYIPAYRYGGPIYSVHGLCKALAGLGHDLHVFTTNVDGDKDSDVPLDQPVDIEGVKVWYFPSNRLRRLYRSPRMKKALNKQIPDFDIIHLHSIFLWPTWTAASLARKTGKPYIIAPRGMLVKELVERKSSIAKKLWLGLIERNNLEHAAAIHVTSEKEKEDAQKFGFKLPPVFVVPNGVDAEELRRHPMRISPAIENAVRKKPFILFLGRIHWKKGLDRLIPALTYLPDTPLVIAGNDEENYRPTLEALAASHGVSSRITFTGPVYGEDKAALLQNASVLVLPSYSENFGNVVLEAMSVGCPVVLTPEVGLADIVRDSGAGMVIDGTPETLGKGLQYMASNPQELKKMGNKGRQAVEEHFQWISVGGQMVEIYNDTITQALGNN